MLCKTCGNDAGGINRKFCSKRCYWRSLEGVKGENAPNYRKVVGKSQVHKWLDTHYGRPKICEGSDCRGNATWYDWALKHGHKYERNRDFFFRLCRSCHRRYDMTEARMAQGMKNLWWVRGTAVSPIGLIKKGQVLNPLGKNQYGIPKHKLA